MVFDPFSSGGAIEVTEKPAGFDPFASGQGVATAPVPDQTSPDEKDSSPSVGSPWEVLYAGLDGMDTRLNPEQRSVFSRLDAVSNDAKHARAQAINQAYLQTQLTGMSHATLERNWPSVKDAYAKEQFGMSGKDVSDTTLYGAISKRIMDANAAEADHGEIKAWTWKDTLGSDLYQTKKGIESFWESINKPLAKLPEAPKDLPHIPGYGPGDPALVGGVYNALKPLVEGVESPLGIATLGGGTVLKELSSIYPLAKAALVGMTGIFTGLMGYGTAKAVIQAPKILNDPNATFEDKVTAVASPVADAGATLLGALGTAMELFPKEKASVLAKELDGKNPAQGAEIMRREAAQTDIPQHSDFLMDAANELDRIASVKDKQAVKEAAKEPVKPTELEKTSPLDEKAPESNVTPLDKGLIGIKNEAIDAELEKMGLQQATHDEKVTFKGEMAKASETLKSDPLAGQKLVEELGSKTRPVTGQEDAILLQEMNRLRIERDSAEKAFSEAEQSGEIDRKTAARVRVAQASDAFQKAADVVTKVGTQNAQGLALRRMMIREDYSLAAMEQRRVVANQGKPLSEEQQSDVRQLHQKLVAAEAKIDAYEKQRRDSIEAPVREAPRRPKPPGKVAQFITDQAEQARSRIKARIAEGRVQSGLDPQDLADHAIIGADYIAKGVTKFSDWSVAMVNELGEQIRPHLQEIFKQAIQAREDASKLQAYKTRTAKEMAKLREKLATGNLADAPRRPIPLDPEALRLKADYERVKRQVRVREMEEEMKVRTAVQKVRDAFQKWVRLGALSYPTVFVKLTSAAVARFVATPIEQLVGFGAAKLLPDIAAKARMEDVPSFGGMVRAESKAFTEAITTGMQGSWDMMRNRDTDLQALLEKEHLPNELIDYLGKLHGAFKYPTQIADYARRLQLVTERDIRAGADPSDPVQQLARMHEAWSYSKRAIFLQDNGVVNAYKAAIHSLESKQKSTGVPSPALQLLSSGMQAELPIVKVPTNVIAEVSEVLTGSLQGPARAAWAYIKGIENLNPGEADAILRLMKKGSIGAAFLALGYYKANNFGGFYQSGEKRKPGDIQPGEMVTGGVTLPRNLVHNPYIEAAQYAATVSRVSGMLVKKSGGDPKGPLAGIVGASIGLFDEVPFVRETTTLGKYADSRQFLSAADAKAASVLIPGLFQYIAAQLDKQTPFSPMESPTPRKATGIVESIQKGIPVLREQLPDRDIKTRLRK